MKFDNSRIRGEALSFEVGSGRMIRGFNDAVVGMATGETKTITLQPETAYGMPEKDAFQNVPKTAFGEDFTFELGGMIKGNGPQGPFLAKIHEVQDEEVVLRFPCVHPATGEFYFVPQKRLDCYIVI